MDDWAISRLSSSGVPPSGSASGSVPSMRRIDSDDEFSTMMKGLNSHRKNCIGGATRLARLSACWIVYSLGTISPMTLIVTVISR